MEWNHSIFACVQIMVMLIILELVSNWVNSVYCWILCILMNILDKLIVIKWCHTFRGWLVLRLLWHKRFFQDPLHCKSAVFVFRMGVGGSKNFHFLVISFINAPPLIFFIKMISFGRLSISILQTFCNCWTTVVLSLTTTSLIITTLLLKASIAENVIHLKKQFNENVSY